jgi:glyoxylase-like metal-dependent hydrolase (beta-lactamase superfamily II)
MSSSEPIVEPFFHAGTSAFAYLIADPASRRAVVIDPVLDFDRRSGVISTEAADAIVDRVQAAGYTVDWVLETHAHADHLSAAAHIKHRLGCLVATGRGICGVQKVAVELFDLGPTFPVDGSQFDRLLSDGDQLPFGGLVCEVLATPGHTPDSVSFLVGGNLFVGDTLFLPDVGTARCDFPGGDPWQLYESVHRLYRLPGATRVFVGHDYPPTKREPVHITDLRSEHNGNAHIAASVSAADFVAFRAARDRTLPLPELYFFALQVNVNAGRLPPGNHARQRHFRVPLRVPRDWLD